MTEPIYKLTDKKPNQKHSNNKDQVLYYCSKGEYFISANWNYPPSEATHWQMLVDAPASTETTEEIQDRLLNEYLKDAFPQVSDRVAMYPIIKRAWRYAQDVK
ncbi:MAG: hypothetical protein CL761_04665 [Chloroflexi bacterium]|nr:hypothetical protein [Chloroflexota bacterium]|tara:strand:+ start:1267 stop:1575 length:309 start_codon:yes stop_codon:yes gene_type:complete